jgi:DNA-binding protein HU-beta
MNVSRTELIDDVATNTGLTKAKAEEALNWLIFAIQDRTQKGQKITLKRFGTFEMKTRAARLGRNPRTGEAVEIAARSTLTFRAAKPTT